MSNRAYSVDTTRKVMFPEAFVKRLPPGGGDGDNGDMEARVARLEATTEHVLREIADVKADVRAVRNEQRTQFYWLLGGFAAMLAVMAKGFGWL